MNIVVVTVTVTHTVCVCVCVSHGVLEMSALCMNVRWKSFTPLVNSRVTNVLVKTAPDLNQPVSVHQHSRCLHGKTIPEWLSISDSQLVRGMCCVDVKTPLE